ncbi:flavodoxin domain-containing protein, partial [Nocardia gipuzkoensis]
GRVVPKRIAALREDIHPREYQPFAGHYERAGVDLFARVLYRTMGGTRYGDLRDWAAIRHWTSGIATQLRLPEPKSSTVRP